MSLFRPSALARKIIVTISDVLAVSLLLGGLWNLIVTYLVGPDFRIGWALDVVFVGCAALVSYMLLTILIRSASNNKRR